MTHSGVGHIFHFFSRIFVLESKTLNKFAALYRIWRRYLNKNVNIADMFAMATGGGQWFIQWVEAWGTWNHLQLIPCQKLDWNEV